jgi:hypothetical protein
MDEALPQELSNDCEPDSRSLPEVPLDEPGESIVVKNCLDEETAGGNRMAMTLKAHGVEFQLDTRLDQRADVLQLAAKLEICLAMLSETTLRLEKALVQVGRLEREVEHLKDATRERAGHV